MQLRVHKDLRYLQFGAFSGIAGLRHGIFTRLGGRSDGPRGGFNLAYGVGDDTAAVAANRGLLAEVFAPGELCFTRQTHGTRVHLLDGNDTAPQQANRDPVSGPATSALPEADALICDRPGSFTVIQVADCQAVLLVDPRRRVVANIHSGWRGSVANIIGETIAVLEARCGSRPADLIAAIGPSLGPCCGEFRNYREELPAPIWSYGNAAAHFDFWALSRDQLLAAGVTAHKIHQSRICTRCNTGLFFSYRHSHQTGRFAAVVGFEQPLGQ